MQEKVLLTFVLHCCSGHYCIGVRANSIMLPSPSSGLLLSDADFLFTCSGPLISTILVQQDPVGTGSTTKESSSNDEILEIPHSSSAI
mmetsp:Transcript_10975/g.20266  ORF Transcript_10975/g.20266 Transcript_10975/m.20266 type:complete len:88 (-) Transcript_10975:870-1133(-)